MKKVNTYVHVYRLQFEATTVNLNIIENFIDAISDAAVISYELTSIGMLGPFRECF